MAERHWALIDLGETLRSVAEGLIRFQESLPMIIPRVSGKVPHGDLRHLANAGETLAQDPRPEVAAIGRQIMAWIEDGAPASLDSYLGLRQQGGVSARRKLALAGRDRALRRLHREHWDNLTAGQAAKMMIQSFERYQGSQWPRDEKAGRASAAQPEATWWQLLQKEHRMLGEKQLKAILQGRG